MLSPPAAIAGTVAIAKKLLPRRESPRPDYITRSEFHQAMGALRDRIDARFLTLSEKIENLGTSIHARRLDNFEGLETRWWIVCGVGAALSAAGVISLVANWKCGFQHGDYIIGGSNRRFRFPSSAFHKFASSGRTRPGFILVAMVFLALCLLINLGQDSDARVAFQSTEIPELISKLPASVSPTALRFYSRIAEGISPIRVPYNPGSGPWIILENAMHGFAVTNGITIVRFEGAGTTTAYVWVSNRDAEAMRKFVRSMGQSANQRLQPAAR